MLEVSWAIGILFKTTPEIVIYLGLSVLCAGCALFCMLWSAPLPPCIPVAPSSQFIVHLASLAALTIPCYTHWYQCWSCVSAVLVLPADNFILMFLAWSAQTCWLQQILGPVEQNMKCCSPLGVGNTWKHLWSVFKDNQCISHWRSVLTFLLILERAVLPWS